MSPHRDETSEHAHHCAADDAEEDELAIEKDRLHEVLVDDPVRDPDEHQREQSAEYAFHEPIDQEGKADEHVRRADQAHDRDLLRAREDGHPDRGADDDDRDRRERDAERDSGDRRNVAQAIELFHPLLTVSDVVDEAIGLHAVCHGFYGRRAPHPRPQMHLDRSWKNAGLEYVRELAHLLPRALERLLLRHVVDPQDFGKLTDVLHRRRDRFDVDAVAYEGANLYALLHLVQGFPDIDRDETEESEGEE